MIVGEPAIPGVLRLLRDGIGVRWVRAPAAHELQWHLDGEGVGLHAVIQIVERRSPTIGGLYPFGESPCGVEHGPIGVFGVAIHEAVIVWPPHPLITM
ncbi:hypothetical protein D3C76_881970 [compost metagenome]